MAAGAPVGTPRHLESTRSREIHCNLSTTQEDDAVRLPRNGLQTLVPERTMFGTKNNKDEI